MTKRYGLTTVMSKRVEVKVPNSLWDALSDNGRQLLMGELERTFYNNDLELVTAGRLVLDDPQADVRVVETDLPGQLGRCILS